MFCCVSGPKQALLLKETQARSYNLESRAYVPRNEGRERYAQKTSTRLVSPAPEALVIWFPPFFCFYRACLHLQLQRCTLSESTVHAHISGETPVNLTVHVFGQWEETGEHEEIPHVHKENIQTAL